MSALSMSLWFCCTAVQELGVCIDFTLVEACFRICYRKCSLSLSLSLQVRIYFFFFYLSLLVSGREEVTCSHLGYTEDMTQLVFREISPNVLFTRREKERQRQRGREQSKPMDNRMSDCDLRVLLSKGAYKLLLLSLEVSTLLLTAKLLDLTVGYTQTRGLACMVDWKLPLLPVVVSLLLILSGKSSRLLNLCNKDCTV